MTETTEMPGQPGGFESLALQILESLRVMQETLHEAVRKENLFKGMDISGPGASFTYVEKAYYGHPEVEAPPCKECKDEFVLTPEIVAKAIKGCSDYMWGQSAIATIFCCCRDLYKMTDNASLFERQMAMYDVTCPPGTISNAMRNNSFMRYGIDKWESKGAPGRVLVLITEFKNQVELLKNTTNDITNDITTTEFST